MALSWASVACLMVVVGTGCLAPLGDCLLVDEHDNLVAMIRQVIDNYEMKDEYNVPFKSYVATFVRLAFHQCVSGKCIGCINVNDSNNNHLQSAILSLEAVRNDAANRSIYVGRADLMALAGIVALNVAEEKAFIGQWQPSSNYTSSIRFRYGRTDCDTAPYTNAYFNFPMNTGGIQHLIYWFQTYLNMTVQETVAIMGLHKLGGLRRGDNGNIHAQWTYGPDALDNSYYRDLSDSNLKWIAGYVSVPGSQSPHYFWRQQSMNNRVMFNCDMGLFKNLLFGSCDPNNVTCTYDTCQQTYIAGSLVQQYAQNNGYWMEHVCQAFQKLIESGYDQLKDLS